MLVKRIHQGDVGARRKLRPQHHRSGRGAAHGRDERHLGQIGAQRSHGNALVAERGCEHQQRQRVVLPRHPCEQDRSSLGLRVLPDDVRERVIFDLGLVRQLGYYTGAVFEVYDPALGTPIGRGGRYDDLLGRFGRPLPAVGFALQVDRVHQALTGEERG